MVDYRKLSWKEIDRKLFDRFVRHQVVTKCWRKENGKWIVKDVPFIDDWSENDYQQLMIQLRALLASGGVIYGAFYNGKLKGFASVDAKKFGSNSQYLDLTNIHVSEDMRGCGIGKRLFLAAAEWARNMGAEKLYISAHSAVESQAFYHAMGCVEAEEYNSRHVQEEPFDCQLEYIL